MKFNGKFLASRVLPILLGCIAGLSILFVGTTFPQQRVLWVVPVTIGLLIVALAFAKRFLPRYRTWFQAGIMFVISGVISSILICSVFVALMLVNFDTEYAPGYSAKAFNSIALGDTYKSVMAKLGKPLSSRESEPFERWIYSAEQQPYFLKNGSSNGTHTTFTFDEAGKLKGVFGQEAISPITTCCGDGQNYLHLTNAEIDQLRGKSREYIRNRFHNPLAVYKYRASVILVYSRSPSGANYHLRRLGLDSSGTVVNIWKSIYWD